MQEYRSILRAAEAEQSIERSRFIAYVAPAESREEAEAFFGRVRAMHRQATHNVPAFIVGARGELQWSSDDGEPQGSSGPPMLQMLDKMELRNVALIVTRYFGGIKLGIGGLSRAYTSSAKLALEAAGFCVVRELEVLSAELEYSHFGRLENRAVEGGFRLRQPRYEEKVRLEIESPPERSDALLQLLADLSGGSCRLLGRHTETVRVPE